MPINTISESEAADFRSRLRAVEDDTSEAHARMDVHEEKCAGRYRMILILVAVSIAINIPGALPHLSTLLQIVR